MLLWRHIVAAAHLSWPQPQWRPQPPVRGMNSLERPKIEKGELSLLHQPLGLRRVETVAAPSAPTSDLSVWIHRGCITSETRFLLRYPQHTRINRHLDLQKPTRRLLPSCVRGEKEEGDSLTTEKKGQITVGAWKVWEMSFPFPLRKRFQGPQIVKCYFSSRFFEAQGNLKSRGYSSLVTILFQNWGLFRCCAPFRTSWDSLQWVPPRLCAGVKLQKSFFSFLSLCSLQSRFPSFTSQNFPGPMQSGYLVLLDVWSALRWISPPSHRSPSPPPFITCIYLSCALIFCGCPSTYDSPDISTSHLCFVMYVSWLWSVISSLADEQSQRGLRDSLSAVTTKCRAATTADCDAERSL